MSLLLRQYALEIIKATHFAALLGPWSKISLPIAGCAVIVVVASVCVMGVRLESNKNSAPELKYGVRAPSTAVRKSATNSSRVTVGQEINVATRSLALIIKDEPRALNNIKQRVAREPIVEIEHHIVSAKELLIEPSGEVMRTSTAIQQRPNGDAMIGTSSPGERLHLADGNTFGASRNPIFELDRIIQAGDGDPELRVLSADDSTPARSVFEVDRKGIVASVKTGRGSHFEGFISGTDREPIFRLNSFPRMRLEMGGGGANPVDVAVQRESASTLTFITGASERARIDSSGNVGVAPELPAGPLLAATLPYQANISVVLIAELPQTLSQTVVESETRSSRLNTFSSLVWLPLKALTSRWVGSRHESRSTGYTLTAEDHRRLATESRAEAKEKKAEAQKLQLDAEWFRHRQATQSSKAFSIAMTTRYDVARTLRREADDAAKKAAHHEHLATALQTVNEVVEPSASNEITAR